MKPALVLTFWLLTIVGFSQDNDRLADLLEKQDSLAHLTKEDSIRTYVRARRDSLTLPGTFTDRVDSLREKWTDQPGELGSSLKIVDVDSLENYYRQKADSLAQQGLPYEHYLSKADSLLKVPSQKVNQQVTQWQQKAKDKLGSVGEDVQEKTGLERIEEELPVEKGLSTTEVESLTGDLSVEQLDIPLEGEITSITGEWVSNEGIDDAIRAPLEKSQQLDQVQEEIDDLKELPSKEITDLSSPDDVQKVKDGVDEVDQWTDELSKAQQEGVEGMENRVGEELGKTTEISELQDKVEAVETMRDSH